jgi:1,4-dihydroxy-6-naphthoate synthase
VTLRLGLSPCPNDTFLFDALLHGRVPFSHSLEFTMADVEELNQRARRGELDITKVSIHAAFHLMQEYVLLRSGAALGRGCGPLLVTRDPSLTLADLARSRIATPGLWTTAQLLLQLMEPRAGHFQEVHFDQVLPVLERGEAEVGLIIHELRFTYREQGFHLLADLGEWWERETGKAIPLGGILARRSLGPELLQELERAIRVSTQQAFTNPDLALPFMAAHAANMDPDIMRQHVGLYVNEFTLYLGEEGLGAIQELHRKALLSEAVPPSPSPIFPSFTSWKQL